MKTLLPVRPASRPSPARRALTLLELIVVMAILVAIAAILIPLLPEYLGKGNQSAAVTNMSELEKSIQTFRATYSRQPNYFDSLLTSSGELSGLLPKNADGVVANGALVVYANDKKGPSSRLTREGISTLYDIVDGAPSPIGEFHATLNPYGTLTPRSVAQNKQIVVLKDESSIPGMILDSTHKYAVFGIGKYCNLCGPDGIVKEAPVYGQHAQENTPSESYQRYAAVYDIGPHDDNTDRYNAKFVAIVAIGSDRLFSCGDLVGTYGDNRFDASVPRK